MKRTALQRLGKISIMISSKPMSRTDLINRLEQIFQHKFSPSQIEKDTLIFSVKKNPLNRRIEGAYKILYKWS